MRRRILGTGLALLGLLSAGPYLAMAGSRPLRLAVLPYASPLTLIEVYRQFQQYLTTSLGMPVEFYTAPSFAGFVDALMAGSYDVAISPPHLAVLAMEQDYVPLLRYRASLEPLLAVPVGSPLTEVGNLRGKRIAMPDRSTFVRLVGEKWLADNGLEGGKDYEIVECASHGATTGAVLANETEAGLMSVTVIRYLPPNIRRELRTIRSGLHFPHVFTIAHRRLGEPVLDRLKVALQAFSDTENGRTFMARTAFGGYREIDDAQLRIVQPYAALYRSLQMRNEE